MAVAVDIDGWIDLVVKEVADSSVLRIDAEGTCTKTPHQSNRVPTGEC
jgi:hypothetical protein